MAEDAEKVEDEDDSGDLAEELTSAEDTSKPIAARREALTAIIAEKDRFSIYVVRVKEAAVYSLARNLCEGKDFAMILPFVTVTCSHFFDSITKAKVAKIVRQVLDIVSVEAPGEHKMLADVCGAVIKWCKECKRTYLRQRVESKLAHVWYEQRMFSEALELISTLLGELKKLDDKQLLVETHLTECKIHHGLTDIAKAKAALTACRTCANAIYLAPALQAEIDKMSGVLHCEEGDYNTAHSYFLEAFEQLDQINNEEKAIPCLKYMMLCKILDSLGKVRICQRRPFPRLSSFLTTFGVVFVFVLLLCCRFFFCAFCCRASRLLFPFRFGNVPSPSRFVTDVRLSVTPDLPLAPLRQALKLSAKGIPGASRATKSSADLSGLITGKQGVKYAGLDIEAMSAIGEAAYKRNLKMFESTTKKYEAQLQADLLIKHHLRVLYEQLLESNLLRLIEPFSCVEISHIANLIDMDTTIIERKISQMILDEKLNGILNQGMGHLIVHETEEPDITMESGLEIIKNMDKAVDNLFKRSQKELVMH